MRSWRQRVRWFWFDYDPATDWVIPIFRHQDFRQTIPISRQMLKCRSLRTIEEEKPEFLEGIVADGHKMRNRSALAILLVVALVLVIFGLTSGLREGMTHYESISQLLMSMWARILSWTLLATGLLVYVVYRTRLALPHALETEILRLVVLIEGNPSHWEQDLAFKRNINRRLEACARQIETLPLVFGLGGDPVNSRRIATMTGGAAARFREYKIWVLQPGPFTFTDLLAALVDSLQAVREGRWLMLPKAAFETGFRAGRLARLGWISLFVAVLVALIGVGYAQAQIGVAASTIAATVFGIVLTSILTRLGVKIAALQQIAETSAKVFPVVKE